MSEPTVPSPQRVLFVGDDASSPQIAASLLRDAVKDRVTVETAGTQPDAPGGRSDEMLVAMGLDPAEEKRLRPGALYKADRVIVLGADIDVAQLPGPRYEEWDLTNDDLIARVEALSEVLTTAPGDKPRWFAVMDILGSLRQALRRGQGVTRRRASARLTGDSTNGGATPRSGCRILANR